MTLEENGFHGRKRACNTKQNEPLHLPHSYKAIWQLLKEDTGKTKRSKDWVTSYGNMIYLPAEPVYHEVCNVTKRSLEIQSHTCNILLVESQILMKIAYKYKASSQLN